MKKWVFSTLIGAGSVVAGAGVATGLILPSTLKLKDGLGKLVPGKGHANYGSWEGKKLNYVALGDSETAGYNGFMHEYDPAKNMISADGDYLSYADFLAKDLQKANKLKSYHNYAVSGATVSDQMQMFLENSQMHEPIKQADFITMTLGANDLLAFVKLLKLQFSGDILSVIKDAASGKVQKVVATNHAKELLFPASDNEGIDVNAGKSSDQTVDLFTQSFDMLVEMAKTKDYTKIIDIEHDFKEEIFELLYGSYMALINQLHKHAPNAQILILGHAMPFEQWPDEVLDFKREDLNGQSIRSMFNRLLDSMKDAANFSLTGKSEYDTYLGVDELNIKKSSDASRDGSGKKFVDYIKKDNSKPDFYVQNAMPNAGDIHPSTFGHELIGNSIFSSIFSHLGVSGEDTDYYHYSTRYTTKAEDNYDVNAKALMAFDENPSLPHSSANMIYDLLRGKGMINNILAKFGDNLSELLHTSTGKEVLGTLVSSLSGTGLDISKIFRDRNQVADLLAELKTAYKATSTDSKLKETIDLVEGVLGIYNDNSIFGKGFITSLYADITKAMSPDVDITADLGTFTNHFRGNTMFDDIEFMNTAPDHADDEKAKIKKMLEVGNAISLLLDSSRTAFPTDSASIDKVYDQFKKITDDIETTLGAAMVGKTDYEITAAKIYILTIGLGKPDPTTGAPDMSGLGNVEVTNPDGTKTFIASTYKDLLASIFLPAASLIM